MAQKKLETDSEFNALDLDGDGTVSDTELAASEALTKHEKADAQRSMAWSVLAALGAFTLAMFFIPLDRVKALSDISNLFYLSGGGLVGAYMSVSVWMGSWAAGGVVIIGIGVVIDQPALVFAAIVAAIVGFILKEKGIV
jgi:hypothetical protein